MGSGFDRLLDQLSHLEINDMWHLENPLASKSAGAYLEKRRPLMKRLEVN